MVSDLDQLTDSWRKLANQLVPSSGPFSGSFKAGDTLDFLAGQATAGGGSAKGAQWLRQISLIVYGPPQGNPYAKPPDITPEGIPLPSNVVRLPGVRDTLPATSTTTLDPVDVNASAPAQAGLELGMLKITFNVHKKTLQTPDLFEARVYNLSPETRKKILQFGRVQLSVGYQFGNYGQVFDGTVVQYRHGKENAVDTYLEIIAGDGDRLNGATSFRRFDIGTQESEAYQTLIKDTGFPVGRIPDQFGTDKLQRPWIVAGPTAQYMREIAQKYGADYWVDKGKLYTVSKDTYLPGEAVVLNPKTGLINIPEDTPNGIQATCLINPKIDLGGRIQLDTDLISGISYVPGGQQLNPNNTITAARYGSPLTIGQWTSPKGMYKIVMMEISGDTRGKQWYMDLTCVALDANDKVMAQTNQSAWQRAFINPEKTPTSGQPNVPALPRP
jgi:hypothetical protein